jgi:hypothetical protein
MSSCSQTDNDLFHQEWGPSEALQKHRVNGVNCAMDCHDSLRVTAGANSSRCSVAYARVVAGRVAILLLLPFALVFVDGCAFDCPSDKDNVSWTSYGRLQFGGSGPDLTARKIISHCSCNVFEGHDGGLFDTLELSPRSHSFVLVWAHNAFSGYRVTSGWKGVTDRGVRLGDSAATFQRLYPEFTVISSQLSTYNDGTIRVEAHFDPNGLLDEILVGNYFRG